MFLLAGLMGVLAVGATALVGLEIFSKPTEDQDDEVLLADNVQDESGEDLAALATAGYAYASFVAPPSTDEKIHEATVDSDVVQCDETDYFAATHKAVFDGAETADVNSSVLALVPDVVDDETSKEDIFSDMHLENVRDFSAHEDRLVVVFDDGVDPDPEVGLEQDEIEQSQTHLTLNGVRIAAVHEADGLTLDHITLVAQSTVELAAAA